MDNKKVSQSGRPQRPTKRFQAYAEQSLMPVAKKRKKEQVHHQEAPSGKVGIGSSFASAPSLTSSTKQKGMREYSCTHCSFSKVCTSSQDFIKMHHMMKDNRRCYEKGLIHCPNPECNKVCLSHKDMEMHCSMKGSKNPCLKSYRDMRAMSSLQMRHSSTQVNFLTSSLDNTTQDTETDLLLHLGTLYNNSKHIDVSLYNPDSPSKPRNRNVSRCGLSIFNIYSQIVALLGNANINSWENYFFTPTEENPFNLNTFTNWNTGQFDGIETSIWYKRTMDRVITDHQNEILVPICLFIDGTVLSLSGSLSLEPVMFSLMIHNRETRQKHEAWLPLGYIHDPTNLAGKKYSCATEKYTDYHHMLSLILKDMTDLVNCNDGLHWEFSNVPGFHRQKVRKKLIFRLAFIIGDTKGHDVLCCRMGSHNKTPGLCRDCNMTTANADNPNISCQFLKQSDLAGLNSEELRKMSFLRVPDYVFNRLSFGVSPYGINGATAIDIIHSILIGIMEYLYNTFIDQLTAKQYVELSKTVAFIATFCSKGMPGFPRIDHFKKGLDVKGIMTAKMKLARCFLVFLALNTVSFKSYLKDMTGKLPAAVQRKIKHRKKHAAEHNVAEELNSSESAVDDENDSECASMESEDDVSVDDSDYIGDVEDSDSDSDSLSLNSSTSYNSEEDSSYDPNDDYESRDPIVFTDNVYKEWSDIFEHTLTFYRWLTLDKMPCNVFKYGSLSIVKHCLDQYMKRYREIAYRHEGMGLKLTKFHQLRHWYFYISMYGVPTNFDSSFCESHHIYLTKRTGRRTQKRQDELAQQTAQRLYEGTLLNAAVARFMRSSRLKRCQRRYADDKLLAGAKFTIQFDYTNIDRDYIEEGSRNSLLDTMFAKQPKIKFRWARKKHNGKKPFPTIILDSITDKLAWFNNGVNTRRIISICGHTEIRCPPSQDKLQRKCIRANPDYRGNGLWTDWVNVSWAVEQDENMILPAQVLMILDFDSVEFEDIPIQIQEHFPVLLGDHATMNHDRRHGIQLLVHSASENVEEDYEFSIIKRFVMEPCFQIIDLENVCDIVFVAREGPILHGNPMTYNITRVFHAKFWGHSFIPRMCEGYTQFPAVELHHLDEFNETYNPW
jgi:hypothetical protein